MSTKLHYPDLSVGGDGGHGDGGDDGDDVGEDDHGEALEDAGLAHHPGQPQEQHHAPDVQETSQIHSLQAASLYNTCLRIQFVSQGPTSNQPNLTAVFSTAIASLVSGSAWELRLQLEELDGRRDSASWGCSEPWVGSLNFYINNVMITQYLEKKTSSFKSLKYTFDL